jgi:hypothetical protein
MLIPAVAFVEFFLKKYTDEDWEAYEKETGNPRVTILPKPKNGIEAAIDEATGFNKAQDLAKAKFLLWNIVEFEKGINGELPEDFEEPTSNNIKL